MLFLKLENFILKILCLSPVPISRLVQNFLFSFTLYICPHGGSDSKESVCSAGDLGLIPGSERSPGEGNGSPLQCSCLENPRTEEPGGLQSTGSQRVGHDWANNTFFVLIYLPSVQVLCLHLNAMHRQNIFKLKAKITPLEVASLAEQ